MQIGLVALGTRGDVQPFLAFAKRLKLAGHEVRLVAGSNFENFVTAHGIDFVPTLDMEALMNSEAGKQWASESSHSQSKQLRLIKKLLLEHGAEMLRPLHTELKTVDLLIGGFVSEPFAQSVSEKYNIPLITAALQPFRPTRNPAASLLPLVKKRDSLLNLLIGKLGERLIWEVSKETVNELRTRVLSLPPANNRVYLKASWQTPTLYAMSRHVVLPSADLPAVQTTGYWFLDDVENPANYQPPADLAAFLQSGPPPVYLGFGSMSDSNPAATLELLQKAVQQSGLRAVIGGGWSGGQLSTSLQPDAQIFWLKEAPHGWLFPQCAAIVHHGGAGTTAAGLRAGVPALLVPHMSDQPFWGRRVHELGVGLKPVARHRLTAPLLAEALTILVANPNLKRAATNLSLKIQSEAGLDNALVAVEKIALDFTKPH